MSRHRWQKIKRRYGLSQNDYEERLNMQLGLCASCFDPVEKPQVDHDHHTGEVRALLCGACNSVAGHANDDVDRLLAVARYLLKWTKQNKEVPKTDGEAVFERRGASSPSRRRARDSDVHVSMQEGSEGGSLRGVEGPVTETEGGAVEGKPGGFSGG